MAALITQLDRGQAAGLAGLHRELTESCREPANPQHHLAAIRARCDRGHRVTTQKPSGARIRCSVCWQRDQRETWLTVPERPQETPAGPAPGPAPAAAFRPPQPPARPPARAAGDGAPPAPPRPPAPPGPGPRVVACRGCGGEYVPGPADAPGRPWGWLSVAVALPPELAPAGRTRRIVGLFCCVACLARYMPELAQGEQEAQRSYAPDRPHRRPVRDDLARLMTQRPAPGRPA